MINISKIIQLIKWKEKLKFYFDFTIKTATNKELDEIAFAPREHQRQGESDDEFHKRIKDKYESIYKKSNY